MARRKPVGHLKRQRRRRQGKKVTVRYADGRSEVVKPGHFQKRKREAQPPSTRTAYRLYLRSKHWRAIRAAALKRDGYKCARCGRKGRTVALEVHHHTYERVGEELLSDVVTLCQPCHAAHHAGRQLVAPPG